jgi:two-component system heavy metal sensor histidine kinase CusS
MSSKSGRDRTGRTPWSLAARLTAWYAGSAFVLILIATGVLYWGLRTSLDREDDEDLADKVRVLRFLLQDRPGDLDAVRRQAERGWAAREHTQVHLRLLDGHGQSVLETAGMGDVLPAASFPPPPANGADTVQGEVVAAPERKSYRVVAARAGDHVIQLALDRSFEEELLAGYRRNLWLVLGVALAGCTLAGYVIARRGLRPVADVTAMARRIRPASLGERLPTAGLPAELLELADTFNAMLGRLEESFGRLARFSADIAHELRTPVNNLRGEAEVALSKARTPAEYRDALGSCLEECGRLARLIDSLLFLARAENPRTQVERERVDVARELTAVREFYEAAAAEAGVALAVRAGAGVEAELCRPLLQRAVGNLVENALAHTRAGGRVTLTAGRDNGLVRVEVSDDGEGIPEEHLPHLLDRFYRVDQARSGATGGIGLGLAIVKGIAELHGGSVQVTSRVGQGTCVTLSFPDANAASPGREGRASGSRPG